MSGVICVYSTNKRVTTTAKKSKKTPEYARKSMFPKKRHLPCVSEFFKARKKPQYEAIASGRRRKEEVSFKNLFAFFKTMKKHAVVRYNAGVRKRTVAACRKVWGRN
jgi:hypothetical protein